MTKNLLFLYNCIISHCNSDRGVLHEERQAGESRALPYNACTECMPC